MHNFCEGFTCAIFLVNKHVQSICDIAVTAVCKLYSSKIAGCSHMQVFLTIEITEKIGLKSP